MALLNMGLITPSYSEDTIKVGVLHSLSGTMAISETTLKDTMLMLIEDQNEKGGLLGKKLEAVGLNFSGISPDGALPEIVEMKDHPWFIGVQFHPELKSKPFSPHPLFASFIEAALHQSRLV